MHEVWAFILTDAEGELYIFMCQKCGHYTINVKKTAWEWGWVSLFRPPNACCEQIRSDGCTHNWSKWKYNHEAYDYEGIGSVGRWIVGTRFCLDCGVDKWSYIIDGPAKHFFDGMEIPMEHFVRCSKVRMRKALG
jgi:hypothetical protein